MNKLHAIGVSAACSEEADMTEAPAQTTTESASGQPAGGGAPPTGPVTAKPVSSVLSWAAASRMGTIVILAVALLFGANLFSKPAWVSQAQITTKPAGFAEVVEKVKPAVVSVNQL